MKKAGKDILPGFFHFTSKKKAANKLLKFRTRKDMLTLTLSIFSIFEREALLLF